MDGSPGSDTSRASVNCDAADHVEGPVRIQYAAAGRAVGGMDNVSTPAAVALGAKLSVRSGTARRAVPFVAGHTGGLRARLQRQPRATLAAKVCHREN